VNPPKKKFGQNFLTDKNIIKKIIDAAELRGDDTVIEVGPGRGALTRDLCGRAKKVIAYEIDGALIPALSRIPNLQIINRDFLKDAPELAEANKFVSNLPYNISTPAIIKALENNFELIIVMVQKEVAERMRARPGTKNYGALSLAVKFRAEAEIIANVSRNCFYPRPNVESTVIKLTPRQNNYENKTELFKIIKSAFCQRRKTLANALCSGGFQKEKIVNALRSLGFDENVRGETLDLEDFINLTRILNQREFG
jgi:16S rRNA (adenine1518-N6/adenine1519-N6)-dimethyltransferase